MRYLLTYSLLFFLYGSFGQVISPFTQDTIESEKANYSFLVSGHFYGGSSNTTGYPTNTLLANLDWLNEQKVEMLVCLGDLFLDVSNDIPKYKKSLFEKLKLPLVNAVGNHDLTGDIYQQNFGDTYFAFEMGNDIHLILDSELNDGNIKGEQLELVKSASEKEYRNIFIYCHRTVWKNMYKEMDGIFEDNTQSMLSNNFESEVLPLLKGASASTIYWFSGSLGGEAPASFFYHQDDNVTYIGTAIRGLPRDAMLRVNVANGLVTFETQSLTGQELEELPYYSVEYWQETSGKTPFNWRLLPLYIKQTIFSWSFFWGAAAATVLLFALRFVIRKRRKKIKPST